MNAPLLPVRVELGDRSYSIHIGSGILEEVGTWAKNAGMGPEIFIVADSNTHPLYGAQVEQAFRAAGMNPHHIEIPAGEASKSSEQLIRLWSAAVQVGMDRRGTVVALGGGVVGDLAGFLAASLFRGVKFLQIPTSLLSMVDSAVGGKTGINLPEGKNLVGAFHQPDLVLCDLSVLSTLPVREFHAGMAEVIKYGCIYDEAFFVWLESHLPELQAMEPDALAHIVRRSCEIKAQVVSEDEREGGLRAILNYGHTLGHAIENVLGYGEWLHGEAISAGMIYASRLSEKFNGLPTEVTARTRALFEAFDLPTQATGLPREALMAAMQVDKKAISSMPHFVLLERLGKAGLPVKVHGEALQELLVP